MDSLLNISSSKRNTEVQEEHSITVTKTSEPRIKSNRNPATSTFSNATEILGILKDQPSFESLRSCLKLLIRQNEGFDIKTPGPISTQIIAVLVGNIIPNYWTVLQDDIHLKERQWLLKCLAIVAGIGALIARLKFLQNSGKKSEPACSPTHGSKSVEVLEVLDAILNQDLVLSNIWTDLSIHVKKPVQRQILWKELISLLASGRLISVAAEALTLLEDRESKFSWLGESSAFTTWLGTNIRKLALMSDKHGNDLFAPAAVMLSRALSLGHNDKLINACFYGLLHGDLSSKAIELELFNHLDSNARTKAFSTMLFSLDRDIEKSKKNNHQRLISGSSSLMKLIVDKNLHLQDFLLNWLACVPSGCIGIGLSMRRAVTTAISSYDGLIANALKKLLTQFGDKLHIQHAPIIMQEVCTQNLLILVGRLFRQERTLLKTIARSSIFINAVSNRLAASSERPRFLGMVTGMAISELIDDSDKRMKFTTDTLNSPDTEWYLQLTGIQDNFGNSDDLKILEGGSPLIQADSDHLAVKKKPSRITESPPKSVASKITSIEEVYSDEDEDFPTYRKPDSDAEDSDDDPTLINRNKPKPPVYIRDLLIYLKDTENHDRHVLAMSHASSLIRRKSTYGAEVTDHIEDLASLICGLKDEHDIATWQSQRLAAMVAIILAQPKPMGKWFANMVFSGDYSISQRASMLTAITLSARELAGYASEDAELTKAPLSQEQLFPSKQLTPKYAKLYLQSINPISSATQTLEHRILHPLTAQALSNTTKPLPSILQTRTFSTRLAVESRKKPINNILSTIVSESLFHPLTNAWQIHTLTHHHTGNSTFNTPLLQSHLLKTLTLILSAAGPNTLSLQTLTSTYWSLLLSPTIRLAATQARNVMEAVLFGLLTLLELNGAGPDGGGGAGGGGRWLAEECGGMIVETRAWIAGVLERCSGGSGSGVRSVGNGGKGGGEDKVGMLAAGVLVRVGEVVEKYERLLMGELASV